MKVCTKCKLDKPLTEFYSYYRSSDKLDYICKVCKRQNVAKRRDPSFIEISGEAYQILLDQQGHTCAICNKPDALDRALALDHDHVSGKVRGLLCFDHNTALGKFNHDVDLLEKAIQYLKE